MPELNKHIFIDKFHSRYQGIMHWDNFEDFWAKLKKNSQNWFYYDTKLQHPDKITANIANKLEEIYNIIKDLHKERYCGLIYVDCLDSPEFVKIFHPQDLGKSCGSSENPPLPRWLISKIAPIDIVKKLNNPDAKKHWIKKILG